MQQISWSFRPFLSWAGALLVSGVVLALMTGCAADSATAPVQLDASHVQGTPWSNTSPLLASQAGSHWQHHRFPGKSASEFRYARLDGRDTMVATAHASASMLRKSLRIEPADLGQLRFSWKVPALIAGADLNHRDADDSPVRVVLAFEGDRSTLSAKNAMLSELAHALTGEPMPYATLMYVWGNHHAPGSVIVNTRTDRVRKLVLESGPQQLGRWLEYERDIRADYEQAFGEAPGALVGIGIMTDSDNTRQQAAAWYGPLSLHMAVRIADHHKPARQNMGSVPR